MKKMGAALAAAAAVIASTGVALACDPRVEPCETGHGNGHDPYLAHPEYYGTYVPTFDEPVYVEVFTPRYFVQQGPVYNGPGLIAPPPFYQDAAVSGWHPYVARGYTYGYSGGPYTDASNHRYTYGEHPSRIVRVDDGIPQKGPNEFEMRGKRKRSDSVK